MRVNILCKPSPFLDQLAEINLLYIKKCSSQRLNLLITIATARTIAINSPLAPRIISHFPPTFLITSRINLAISINPPSLPQFPSPIFQSIFIHHQHHLATPRIYVLVTASIHTKTLQPMARRLYWPTDDKWVSMTLTYRPIRIIRTLARARDRHTARKWRKGNSLT